MKVKKELFDEVVMIAFGTGAVLMGVSGAYVGATAVRKNFYAGGFAMALGAVFAHAGYEITAGAIGRIRGK